MEPTKVEQRASMAHSTAIGTSQLPGMPTNIPPSLNFYVQLRRFWLGRSPQEKLFAASLGWGMFSKTIMTLYNGSTSQDPVMATSNKQNSAYTITLGDGPEPLSVKSGKVRNGGTAVPIKHKRMGCYGFTMDGVEYEWLRGSKKAVKKVDSGSNSNGWKLTRVLGSKDDTEQLEILASVDLLGIVGMDKSASFNFLGNGITAEFSQEWKLVALLSGLLLWYSDYIALTAAIF